MRGWRREAGPEAGFRPIVPQEKSGSNTSSLSSETSEHVNGSGGYSEVHLAAEHDTTLGLVVRALGEGSREGMGRGHRQR